MSFKVLSIILTIILHGANMQNINPYCNFQQEMTTDVAYYVYTPNYPSYYSQSEGCKWYVTSDYGTKIILTCSDVDIPQTQNCAQDRLAVSVSGDPNLRNARTYCGQGSLSLESDSNALTIGLFSPNTRGSRISCTIVATTTAVTIPTEPTVPNCQCGYKNEERIVGGQETGINEYPMMAGLIVLQTRQYYCGATIISSTYVVTAGHCVANFQPNQMAILVGDHNINAGSDTNYSEVYTISQMTVHPGFREQTLLNDIALVKTVRRIEFNVGVGPACLPFQYMQNNFFNQSVIALGWGSTEFLEQFSDSLREAHLRITTCQANDRPIADTQICSFNSNQDTCQGDSGGPLLWQHPTTRRLYLIGVISYGGDCNSLEPSFNTRITSYINWIVSETRDSSYCIL